MRHAGVEPDGEIRAGGDCGMPITVNSPESKPALVFRSIAEGLLARLKV